MRARRAGQLAGVGLMVLALAGWDSSGVQNLRGDVQQGVAALKGERFTNALGMEFVAIPAGNFMMGCDQSSGDSCNDRELPRHPVQVEAFYMQTTEVTQAQFQAVMNSNPSRFKGSGLPVDSVTWHEAREFVQRLSQQEGCTNCYRLPSEAQWEYAYRAGSQTIWPHGNDQNSVQSFGHHNASASQPVAMLLPNAWGLYDMGGNLWEWVEDCWHSSYNGASAYATPWNSNCEKVGSAEPRVLRGGSLLNNPDVLRAAYRSNYSPVNRYDLVGFRVVRVSVPRTQ